jgi:sigma-54 specific flagellar transcriptional regulator A
MDMRYIKGIMNTPSNNNPRLPDHHSFPDLIGHSQPMQALRYAINQVAAVDTSVLLLGASGTGKDVVAHCIHQLSSRHAYPFVPVNCAAIPAELMESELFGHEKGAFTGAFQAREGRFELAHQGSLFLDEIGDMPLAMQVKLLRVLQENRFERVGGSKSIDVNVRIIAATNKDLEQAIAENTFREDLFYRLNVFPIVVPTLQQRADDIPLLLEHFIEKIAQRLHSRIQFTTQAIHSLQQYPWPGNIRELVNFVERMMVLYPNTEIDIDKLEPAYISSSPTTKHTPQNPSLTMNQGKINLKQYLAEIEIKLIHHALQENDNVISYAAEYLSIGRTTLIEKMRKYGIRVAREKSRVES